MRRNEPVRGAMFVRRYLINRDVLRTYVLLLLGLYLVGLILPQNLTPYLPTAEALIRAGCRGLGCGVIAIWINLALLYPVAILIAPKVRGVRKSIM